MESLTFFGVTMDYFGVFRKLLDNSRSFHVGDTLEFSCGICAVRHNFRITHAMRNETGTAYFSSVSRPKCAHKPVIKAMIATFTQVDLENKVLSMEKQTSTKTQK